MPDEPAKRVSALDGHYSKGQFGPDSVVGVRLAEIRELTLHQVASWPETWAASGAKAAKAVGATSAPGLNQAAVGRKGALLRVEPLKMWVLGRGAPQISPHEGAVLDLSHSRTHLRISGPEAALLLNRHLPLDLRNASFPVGTVASTAFHHVGVALWRSDAGFEVFLPRGFAVSLWQVLLESAA